MKLDAIRYHIEDLVNNLYVEKLPRRGREPQLYVYRDVLKDFVQDDSFGGLAREVLYELSGISKQIRHGEVFPEAELIEFRREIGEEVDQLKEEYENLAYLHDCLDLWTPNKLVERLGFIEDQ